MLKNIQIKIIIIFMIIGIIMIAILGTAFTTQLENLKTSINVSEQETKLIEEQITQTKVIMIILIVWFFTISVLLGVFVAKVVIAPITNIVKNAQKAITGDYEEVDVLQSSKDNEVNELSKAFGLMTNELKENLNEVNRQKKQIETILLHMTDGVIAFNKNGNIIHMNPAATRLLRIMPEDDTFTKIFDKLKIDINIEKVIYLESWTSSEQKVNIGDKFVDMVFAPFKDENERPSGVIAVIQDITEHVKLDNIRKEFVANVSHELKTPITSIMGYADTLAESEYDKEMQEKFLKVISSEARRMAKLVTDLLTLSKFDNNQNILEKTEFDLGNLVKECKEKLNIEIKRKRHDVECYVTADVPMVYAQKDGIERVVLNILSNSIKYTPEGGKIKIYVGFVYNDAYIKILDNGLGIPESDLSRIFERFYRVDKARTRQMGGTGLGLSIAKEILDQNNGSIDIKSELGKGTEVVIRVPTVQRKSNK